MAAWRREDRIEDHLYEEITISVEAVKINFDVAISDKFVVLATPCSDLKGKLLYEWSKILRRTDLKEREALAALFAQEAGFSNIILAGDSVVTAMGVQTKDSYRLIEWRVSNIVKDICRNKRKDRE
ncbi:hypothetical protein CJ030_MR8G006234 [Morella rubra]|uniref:RNase H type-1 domain-containing protein n=1 Tax=Morella rubra TaxID=262757 RepID=A0A6A1UPP5_9ROSI|nr:hypothetical protein CJ030_MR8G006234 [Morella rubra]